MDKQLIACQEKILSLARRFHIDPFQPDDEVCQLLPNNHIIITNTTSTSSSSNHRRSDDWPFSGD
jgi:hypothetical protein